MNRNARGILFVVFFLTLATATMWIVYSLRTPELYAGDEMESRDCRWCGGTGEPGEFDPHLGPAGTRCSSCGGTGTVRVIVPGSARPTRVRGIVLHSLDLHPQTTYSAVKPRPGPPGSSRSRASKKSIGGAKLIFENGRGERREVETTPYGMFNELLEPGRYVVSVEAKGYLPLAGTVTVPRLTHPIWLEEGTTYYEPESFAEAQSLYGLEFLAALSRREGLPAWMRLDAGTP